MVGIAIEEKKFMCCMKSNLIGAERKLYSISKVVGNSLALKVSI